MIQNILNFSRRLSQHELITGSMYVLMGSMVTNILAFLFNLLVARKLQPVDYGIYASLLSLFSLISLLPQSLLATILQYATKYFSQNNEEHAKNLYKKSLILLVGIGFAIIVVLFITAPFLGTFLHIKNNLLIGSVGFLVLFNFVSALNTSFLQGLLEFGFMSIIQAVGALVKFLIGLVLVFLAFGVTGALIAVALSFLTPFLVSFFRLKFLLSPSKKETTIPLWEMVRYAIPSMLTIIALSSFISTDVILVKHFLSGTQAGLYAGLSLVSKVILYFTGVIPAVMFPILIRRQTKGHGVQNTFYMSLILVGIPSAFIVLFYFLFPHFVINLFLGGKQYLQVSGYVGMMAIFLALYSVITVMVNFFLSLKQTRVVFPVVAMAFLQVLLIWSFHTTILQVILDSLIVLTSLFVLLGLYYLYHQKIAKTYTPHPFITQEV